MISDENETESSAKVTTYRSKMIVKNQCDTEDTSLWITKNKFGSW